MTTSIIVWTGRWIDSCIHQLKSCIPFGVIPYLFLYTCKMCWFAVAANKYLRLRNSTIHRILHLLHFLQLHCRCCLSTRRLCRWISHLWCSGCIGCFLWNSVSGRWSWLLLDPNQISNSYLNIHIRWIVFLNLIVVDRLLSCF